MRRHGDAPLRFTCSCGHQVTSKYALKKHKLVCSGRPAESPTEKDAA